MVMGSANGRCPPKTLPMPGCPRVFEGAALLGEKAGHRVERDDSDREFQRSHERLTACVEARPHLEGVVPRREMERILPPSEHCPAVPT